MDVVMVFAPHNDDHALAMGATIAKHYKQKDAVHTYVASFGEMSHPHFKPEVIRKMRVKEAQRADRAYGGKGRVQFLGLREGKFQEDFKRKGLREELIKRMRKLKPTKIYVCGENELHPDHKAISKLILKTVGEGKIDADVYAYYVYPNLRHPKSAKLFVDVSEVYSKKIKGLHAFKSQIHLFTYAVTNNLVYIYALARNWLTGFLHGKRFIETFYKIR